LASANLQKQLYGESKVQYPGSHAVRAEALDFSGDGVVDVLIFENGSTSGFQGSQIQFLKNMGGGKFEDVTDNTLLNYPLKSQITYNPIVLDINGDSKLAPAMSVGTFGSRSSMVCAGHRKCALRIPGSSLAWWTMC
jgi:hypothetical protein